MTIRILNPRDWKQVTQSQYLELLGDHERIVKLELNADAPARADLVWYDGDGEEKTTFLGVFQGLERFEFVADANAKVAITTESEVWFCTNDGVATAVEIPEEASFTKLVGRKSRSEQLEHIIRVQQAGIDRLVMAQEAERIEYERVAEERDALQQAADNQAATNAAEAERLEQADAKPVTQPGADDSPASSAVTVPA